MTTFFLLLLLTGVFPFYLYAQDQAAATAPAPTGQAAETARQPTAQPQIQALPVQPTQQQTLRAVLAEPQPPQPPETQAPSAPAGIKPAQVQVAVPSSVARGQFSFNFDDADVFSVIQTVFGDVLKVNYVVDPKVKGRVTFRSVAPVPKENVLPLMEVILRLNGIAVVEESGLYRIIPLADLAREPSPVGFGRDSQHVNLTGKALLQVIPINYMASSEVVKLVSPFLSTNAIVVDVPKINHIIVVDTDASVKRILSLVDIFDSEQQKKKRPQVFVYPVQNGKAKDVTALLQQIFLGARAPTPAQTSVTTAGTPGSPASPQTPLPASPMSPMQPGMPGTTVLISTEVTRIFANDVTNSIVVLAIPEDYQVIKETIEKIDVVPRQVIIEALIAQVNLTDNLSLGVAAAFKTNIGSGAGLISSGGDQLAGITVPVQPSAPGFTFIGTDSAGAVRALVSALESESRGKVLAAPHILVSDNREAHIQVGQSVPLVTSQTYGAVGVAPQQSVEYKDIGIILKVKPQVNEGGLVSLELHEEVSSFTTQTLFSASTQIIINKTEATSNVVVQNGETIVIGGLIQENTTRSLTGIPYLSKIPVLGYLFGARGKDVTRTEIIMLLTPRVLINPKDAKDATSDYVDKFTERGSIKKEDLHWVNPPKQNQGTQGEESKGQGK
ncbi:MAG TPA: secretin N-terminal domain-containing protein [Syntrophorhabdales bacterium]|nr:secretin N-terminal domain-containing protein [Syntrophorhabdales bacterium]